MKWCDKPDVYKPFKYTRNNRYAFLIDIFNYEEFEREAFIKRLSNDFTVAFDNTIHFIEISTFDDAILELSNRHENEIAELRYMMENKLMEFKI